MSYSAMDCEIFIPNSLLMNGGGIYNLGPGQGTDQTEIMLNLCYGLIAGEGKYNPNLVAKEYMQWFEGKPFNFSAVFALSMKDLRKMKTDKIKIDESKVGEILLQSSRVNKNQESSIGLIRILPLTIFSLKFSDSDFE
jgi:ADP-ribosylglycohydrolase